MVRYGDGATVLGGSSEMGSIISTITTTTIVVTARLRRILLTTTITEVIINRTIKTKELLYLSPRQLSRGVSTAAQIIAKTLGKESDQVIAVSASVATNAIGPIELDEEMNSNLIIH